MLHKGRGGVFPQYPDLVTAGISAHPLLQICPSLFWILLSTQIICNKKDRVRECAGEEETCGKYGVWEN